MSDITFLAAALRVKIEDIMCSGKENRTAASVEAQNFVKDIDKEEITSKTRLQIEKIVSALAITENIGSVEEGTQVMEMVKLENQGHKIFTLNQELQDKAETITILERDLKEISASWEKVTRDSERKDEFLNAIHADIDSLKSILQNIKENFKQTRSELLSSKTVQSEHIQFIKKPAHELMQKDQNIGNLQCLVETKDAKLLIQLTQIGRAESLVSSLQLELEDLRQRGKSWLTKADEAQALVLELHTRMYEMQSKYASTDSMVADVLNGMQDILSEHEKMRDM